MSDDNPDLRGDADGHFNRLRDNKTANTAKIMNQARVKADSDKTARLKAARMARNESRKGEALDIPPAEAHAAPGLTKPEAGSPPDGTASGGAG